MKLTAFVAFTTLLAFGSSASAVIITGGPSYTLPGGGSCSIGGSPTTVGGGATLSCTGIATGSHTKVYIAMRVDQFTVGNTMTGADPASSSSQRWDFSSSGATSITYTSTTPANSLIPAFGNNTATSTLVINRTSGTGSVVAAGGNPADNAANGDVGALFLVTSATQNFDVDITANRPGIAVGQASTVYDILHGTAGGGGERSRVDVAFYWSDCGDGQVDSPEVCDDGGANGSAGSCCTTSCTFKTNGTACTDDGNTCTNDQCNGASNICQHPNKTAGSSCTGNGSGECSNADTCNGSGTCLNNDVAAGTQCTDLTPTSGGNCIDAQCNGTGTCNQAAANEVNGAACADGDFCNGADQCNGGTCSVNAGDPCDGPGDADADCSETCVDTGYEVGNCNGTDPNGTSCTDALFCNGTDTCAAGACTGHSGDPCLGPDGDNNCAESCDEGADNCLAPDPNGSACDDGTFCNGTETCGGGTCGSSTGDPCAGPDGDGDCSETCDEGANNCNGSDPNGSSCTDGLFCNGTDTCGGGLCNVHVGDPCTGPDGDGDCAESCDEGADNCLGDDPNGSSCTDSVFCNGADTCSAGACTTHAGDPCDGPDGDGDCSETCDEGAGNCDGSDVDGSTCTDGVFCNGNDTCAAGLCDTHTGDPCDGPDGDLDCSETCNEGGANCNGSDPDGGLCRPDTGECDVEETCLSGACPVDGFESNGTACGSPTDTDCDNPDTCNGNNFCLANLEPALTACGDGSDTSCTDPDTCDGAGACEDNHEPVTTSCRVASAGQECDAEEFCDGVGNCPVDGVLPASTLCRGEAGICDVDEVCDGVNFDCPADEFEPSTTSCRADTGECDVEEFCTGSGAFCPGDDFEPTGTACGSPGDTDCDNPDTCDGNNTCIINNEPANFPCTSDGETCTADICDGASTCTHPAGNAGTECRAGSAGQLCDEPEECDGVNPTCPADAVKANGEVCRADQGECDTEELCDGVSSLCPTDIFEPDGTTCGDPSDTDCTNPDSCLGGACDGNHEPVSLQCRAASAGQLCDAAEFCDGAGNCPADAPAPNGTTCRAGVDVCDLAETCDGSSFDCPADAKSTGVCRIAAGVCDVADSCDGINDACPADIKSTAECRPAAPGGCDVAESCDGVTNDCPANAFQPNNTPCSDGAFCNGAESCQSGSCTAGADPCPEFCDEGSDMCLASSCAVSPLVGCRTAQKSLLLMKNKDGQPDKDKLVWKWIKGQTTSQMEFADPTDTASYGLCIYDATGLVGTMDVPPGSNWTPISDKGYKYFDINAAQDGAFKIKLKGSTQPKSKALVKGRGAQLPDTLDMGALTLPVKVQLVNNENGICFESNFATAKLNNQDKFKAKTP